MPHPIGFYGISLIKDQSFPEPNNTLQRQGLSFVSVRPASLSLAYEFKRLLHSRVYSTYIE